MIIYKHLITSVLKYNLLITTIKNTPLDKSIFSTRLSG